VPPLRRGGCLITHPFPYDEVSVKIILALGIGLVVGLECEWAHEEVGARTFAITTLLGALAPLLAREFVIAALIGTFLYPLLPDRFVDPWALVNPPQAWVTVIAIASLGFLNYVLLRLYSMRGLLYYAALLGGLVNSTAAVAELAASFKASEPRPTTRAVALILLTTVAMFLHRVIASGKVNLTMPFRVKNLDEERRRTNESLATFHKNT
jgi:uncharacterized membrane protein (DUF4010 family)